MTQNVQIAFNAAATAALFAGKGAIRVAPFTKARVPSFVGRETCKTAETLHGFGTAFAIVDGCAVIVTPISQYLARMENLAPVPGTYFLKQKSKGESLVHIATTVVAPKEGKVALTNPDFQVTISLVDANDDEPRAAGNNDAGGETAVA